MRRWRGAPCPRHRMRAQRAQGHEGMARPANGSPQQGGDRGRPEAAQPEVLGVPQGRNRRRRPATTGAGDGDFFPAQDNGSGSGWGAGRGSG
jgi:hypothetical protein